MQAKRSSGALPELGDPYRTLLESFVRQLRDAGLPISLSEYLDASVALGHGSLRDRETLRNTLALTLIKHQSHLAIFDTIFQLFFSTRLSADVADSDVIDLFEFDAELPDPVEPETKTRRGSREELSDQDLQRLALEGLQNDDQELLKTLARRSVRQFAHIEPGRPVGGTYYLFKTIRGLNLDGALDSLMDAADEQSETELTPLERRLTKDEMERRIAQLKSQIEAEIRRQLVADRGSEALARSLRSPLPQDVDFMHASRDELEALKKAMYPLTRKLAARLARKRRHKRRGPLDFRRTVRHSLNYGGVPAELVFRHPKPAKPEIFVIADISGSVAAFARFTLHLTYAISGQFSRVRSFVFIDGVDEVTNFFEKSDDIAEAIHRVNSEADVIASDGHSDYGHALTMFWERFGLQVTSKSTVLILGDARNNYHSSEEWVVKELQHRSRKLFWLNPEPKAYWDTGDSVMSDYGDHCDGVFEARNLRQLERFVDNLV